MTEWRAVVLKVVVAMLAVGGLSLLFLWVTLPNIDDPETMFPAQSTVILDRNGVELYRLFSEQDRTYIRGEDISEYVKKATIAIEDERFFSRSSCFDVEGFARAVLSQIAPRYFVRSGGSTLTQQFAGNALVGRHHSLIRKVRELMLACSLERKYNKDELLELYLNWIPYGLNAYGIEQASKNYFAKSARQLTLAEASILAALPQRPTYFNPYGSHVRTTISARARERINTGEITSAAEIPDADVRIGLIAQTFGSGTTRITVGGRTDQVLMNMVTQHLITDEQRIDALAELQRISFVRERKSIRAAHFVLGIEEEVKTILGIQSKDPEESDRILQQGGMRITTTVDWNIQQAAEKAVAAHREDIRQRFGAHNIALVALSPLTREVLAYVGNADYNDDEHEGKIDMVRAPRQPGSSFKAFTYLAAFEAGYGPGSVVYDVPTKFGDDEPQNFDGSFWGPITIRRALGGSRNIPAIKAFFLAGGEEALLSLVAKLGIVSPTDQKSALRKTQQDFDYGWPLAIGAAETPLYEMVQGYASIADGGRYRQPTSILKITNKDGSILFAAKEQESVPMVDERLAAMVTSILSDASARPNDFWKTVLSVPGYDSAAKTGTSNKCLERDVQGGCKLRRPESAWTLGYTPNIIAGVWVGNATSQSLFEKADGLTAAAPVWRDFMVNAHRAIEAPIAQFTMPQGLASPLLSKLSGKLASACTPVTERASDLVLEESVPTEDDPACTLLGVDKVTGLLASATCPIEATEEQPFFVPRSERPERWPLWEKDVQQWAKEQMERWRAHETHSGSLLPLALAPTESCDPAKTPGRFDPISISIDAPVRGSRVPYPSFEPVLTIDARSPIKSVEFFVDDKPIRSFTEAPFKGSIRVPRTVAKEGTHTLRVVLTDAYFKTASDVMEFEFE